MRRETLRRKVEVQIGQRKRLRFNRPEEKQSTGGNYQEKGGRVRGRKRLRTILFLVIGPPGWRKVEL